MLTLLAAAVFLSPQQSDGINRNYNPAGPVIEVTMENKKTFEITTDPKNSPKTVAHILDLVRKGFYDGQRVHRVEWWVTQWGAPESKTQPLDIPGADGTVVPNDKVAGGGSGKDIPVFEKAQNVDFLRGVVGIASTGFEVPGDSQIFILRQDALRLYGSYAVLGKVTKGMDVVGTIARGNRIKSMKVKL